MKNKTKFILSILAIPIPQLIMDKLSNNPYNMYENFNFSIYAIYFAVMLSFMALYFLLMCFLEKYNESKH